MTTFQIIIDSVLRVFSGVVPVSYQWGAQLEDQFLHFTSHIELDYLITLILSVAFLIYFRFDWLGILSALAKTIAQPKSIKRENRTLDQEVLIFLTAITVPSILLRHWILPLVADIEILNSPVADGILFLVAAGLMRFAYRWNRRIRGLNHLRTIDAIPIILVSILSAHTSFPLALVLWVGMCLTNYHYDAIFKYSMLLLGMRSIAHLFNLMGSVNFSGAMESIGHLNGIAVIVVSFTFVWMTIEQLQKNLSENTMRWFQWFSVFASLSSFALHFLRG